MTLLLSLIEPKRQFPKSRQLFTNQAIISMTIPLLIEQFLQLIVGIADSMISSHAGQEVVAGISLVTTIYTVFIFLFTGLSLGGSVAISQALGRKNKEDASLIASQTFTISFLFSVACMILMLLFGNQMLKLFYGKVEPGVMEAAQIYFQIVVLSFPANAIYNAGAGLYKSLGKTKVTMYIAIAINLFNIIGDYIGVFILHKGAAGVAWPTTISWYVAAVAVTVLSVKKENYACITASQTFHIDQKSMGEILHVAVPNSIENGLFQVSKLVLASIIATFGTVQLAANGIGQTIWNLTSLPSIAINPVFVTVIGRACGAGDRDAAKYYFVKLSKFVTVIMILWNIFMTATMPLYLKLYSMTPEVHRLIIQLAIVHNIFTALFAGIAYASATGMKAAGDVKFCLYSALFCTCFIRVAVTFIFGVWLKMGIHGYMWAMYADWVIKAILILNRYRTGKWLRYLKV